MRLTVLLWITSLLLLAACAPDRERDRDPALEPPPGELETAQTPLGVDDPAAGTASAMASLAGVAGSGATGQAELYETPEGLRVLAEVGGLSDGTYGMHVLERTDCAGIQDARATARTGDPRDLGTLRIATDGTAIHEMTLPELSLHGERSVLGRAVVVTDAGDQAVACGIIEGAAGGIGQP